MFQCRCCADNIFEDLFGVAKEPKSRRTVPHPNQSQNQGGRRQRRSKPFRPRSEKDVRETVQEWQQYLHPHAMSDFTEPGMLEQVLATIAEHIDKNDDPVFGSLEKCVVWRGDILQGDTYIPAPDVPENDDTESPLASAVPGQELMGGTRDHLSARQAVFRLVKPGEGQETVAYINRILSFAFAAEESFELLMSLPKEPFRMSCGNQLCVLMGHIHVEL